MPDTITRKIHRNTVLAAVRRAKREVRRPGQHGNIAWPVIVREAAAILAADHGMTFDQAVVLVDPTMAGRV